jgi:hypothetical protein
MAVGEKNIPPLTHRRGPGRDSWRAVNAAQWDGTGRPWTRRWQAAGRGGGVWRRRRFGQAPWWLSGVREGSRRGPLLEQ